MLRLISIHALREEGDFFEPVSVLPAQNFYPRPPRGGRRSKARQSLCHRYFYPRPPRGGRLLPGGQIVLFPLFLSTPSARRATFFRNIGFLVGQFLSTPSARRATNTSPRFSPPILFLSTPSARRATDGAPPAPAVTLISIHALREEGDRLPLQRNTSRKDFYPRPPRGGRRGL